MTQWELPHQHGQRNAEHMREKLAQTERFAATAEIFRQLSDATRLKIFWLLCHQEQCVANIAALMDMSSPAVSHHLRSLQDSALIVSRRDGKEVYYRVEQNGCSELLHKVMEQVMQIACPEDGHGNDDQTVVYAVHEYLLEHMAERISIEALSKQFLMNPTTLKKLFKQRYGDSLAAHVKRHRLEKAAQLLRTTDMSIAQIAVAVGYESQSRLSAAFKSFYGQLPRDYRRQRREE